MAIQGFDSFILYRRRAPKHGFSPGPGIVYRGLQNAFYDDAKLDHSYVYTPGIVDTWGMIHWGRDSEHMFCSKNYDDNPPEGEIWLPIPRSGGGEAKPIFNGAHWRAFGRNMAPALFPEFKDDEQVTWYPPFYPPPPSVKYMFAFGEPWMAKKVNLLTGKWYVKLEVSNQEGWFKDYTPIATFDIPEAPATYLYNFITFDQPDAPGIVEINQEFNRFTILPYMVELIPVNVNQEVPAIGEEEPVKIVQNRFWTERSAIYPDKPPPWLMTAPTIRYIIDIPKFNYWADLSAPGSLTEWRPHWLYRMVDSRVPFDYDFGIPLGPNDKCTVPMRKARWIKGDWPNLLVYFEELTGMFIEDHVIQYWPAENPFNTNMVFANEMPTELRFEQDPNLHNEYEDKWGPRWPDFGGWLQRHLEPTSAWYHKDMPFRFRIGARDEYGNIWWGDTIRLTGHKFKAIGWNIEDFLGLYPTPKEPVEHYWHLSWNDTLPVHFLSNKWFYYSPYVRPTVLNSMFTGKLSTELFYGLVFFTVLVPVTGQTVGSALRWIFASRAITWGVKTGVSELMGPRYLRDHPMMELAIDLGVLVGMSFGYYYLRPRLLKYFYRTKLGSRIQYISERDAIESRWSEHAAEWGRREDKLVRAGYTKAQARDIINSHKRATYPAHHPLHPDVRPSPRTTIQMPPWMKEKMVQSGHTLPPASKYAIEENKYRYVSEARAERIAYRASRRHEVQALQKKYGGSIVYQQSAKTGKTWAVWKPPPGVKLSYEEQYFMSHRYTVHTRRWLRPRPPYPIG
jgi:hypothetical protein